MTDVERLVSSILEVIHTASSRVSALQHAVANMGRVVDRVLQVSTSAQECEQAYVEIMAEAERICTDADHVQARLMPILGHFETEYRKWSSHWACDPKMLARLGHEVEVLANLTKNGACQMVSDQVQSFRSAARKRFMEHGGELRPRAKSSKNFGAFATEQCPNGTILIAGQRYKHIPPVRLERRVATLPKQSLATCYFFSAINAMLNETTFAEAFIRHIKTQIDTNTFARRSDESVEDANSRRFGRDVAHRITVSEQFEGNTEVTMAQVYRDLTQDKDLFLWSRNVILYHTLSAALRSQSVPPKTTGSAFDSRAAMFMTDLTLPKYENVRYSQLLQELHEGWVIDALEDIFRLNNLKIRTHGAEFRPEHRSMTATIPVTGETLCIGAGAIKETDIGLNDDNGSYTGTYVTTNRKNETHIRAYVCRDVLDEEPLVIESASGDLHTLTENAAFWAALEQQMLWTTGKFDPMFTCIIPQHSYGGGPHATDSKSVVAAKYQAAVLVPKSLDELVECGQVTCGIDDDLKAALYVVNAFTKEEGRSEGVWDQSVQGGAGVNSVARIGSVALMTVTLLMTMLV